MEQTITKLNEMDDNTRFKCIDNLYKKEYRAIKEDKDHIFIFAKGYKTKGYRYSTMSFAKDFTIKEDKKDITAQWHSRIKRAIKCMNDSGLWKDIKQVYENLLTISYEEKDKILKMYHNFEDKNSDENTLAYLKNNYNFMLKMDENGKEYIDTNYIYEISDCKLKSMYFGKHNNKSEKETIKQKIKDKQDYSNWARTNYDTSFRYRAKDNRAWYSEEYKGCGNGHYYLALDHNTALFCEND